MEAAGQVARVGWVHGNHQGNLVDGTWEETRGGTRGRGQVAAWAGWWDGLRGPRGVAHMVWVGACDLPVWVTHAAVIGWQGGWWLASGRDHGSCGWRGSHGRHRMGPIQGTRLGVDKDARIFCGNRRRGRPWGGGRKIGKTGFVERNVTTDDYFAGGQVQTPVAFVLERVAEEDTAGRPWGKFVWAGGNVVGKA